jgi:hypothetical protein
MTIAEQMNYTPTPNTGNSTDTTVYGHLYQWGRIADGHQLRNSSAVNGGSGATSITYDANSQIPLMVLPLCFSCLQQGTAATAAVISAIQMRTVSIGAVRLAVRTPVSYT